MFLWATLIPAVAQETKPLSLEEALTRALKTDPGIRSSSFDLLASQARSKDAVYRMIPSLAVSTGYTQLSEGTHRVPCQHWKYHLRYDR